ncbi:semaphorin-4F isoform X1 [Danio rerio]|uniref:Semaphorin-4F isoform X1 n=1 Tax=Danio rerio TaxID=7955 RepID=A0A8M2BE08_DANRE|nr:semaphorin-4F isoform X1 [Danio rerio]|eukprot:XP_005166611.1 semaphorin-4F isoform X1 [Danio rerio]
MNSVTGLFVLSVLLCSTLSSWSATVNSNGAEFPRLSGFGNLSTFLLHSESGMLYLGARDAVIVVDTAKLSKKMIEWSVPEDRRKSCVAKGKTEDDCRNYVRLLEFLDDGRIYACGTFAFDPQCAFINISTFSLEKQDDGFIKMETGKGKCPFEPSQPYTAVMAGGILYTAVTSNFLGTMYDISRATGIEQERIRTEQSINWLSDPEFISSAFIQEDAKNNPTGEDDKIYFFFTEVAKEYDLYTKVKVPRVARVCKSDVGGMKTLQRRWTTFLKAQLVCEDRASGQRFNILTDVFTVQHQPGDPSSTHFYGIFTSQWEREELSAVCVYSLEEITKVMNGPFKELKKSCENWINPEPIPTPRPGQCLNSDQRELGFESSLKLPDKVLTFMRDHPLMENSVVAVPLMIRYGITYTKLAVTLTPAFSGQKQHITTVLHLGTDHGELHKVAVVGPNATLIEEITLFSAQEPVNNILLYKGEAVVGSPHSLVKLPILGCSLYSSCEVCARAGGLGCIWRHNRPACAMAKPGEVVEAEDLVRQCNKREGLCSPPVIEMRVVEGLRVLLSCVQLSPRPCHWDHPPGSHTRHHNYDLEVQITNKSLGIYVCLCDEAGRDQPPCRKAVYQLTLDNPRVEGNKAIAGSRHFMASHIFLFVIGFMLGGILLFLIYKRQGGMTVGGNSSSTLEKGRDLLHSTDTPQSPSSASLLSEAVPITEKRNGTLNGHGHSMHPGGHNGRHIYTNSSGLKLQESAVNLADELDGRERAGPDGEEEGLEEGLSEMEEAFSKMPCLQGAPLAQCEESSI